MNVAPPINTNGPDNQHFAERDSDINPTGMYGRVILVTPEFAAHHLAMMPRQRNLRRERLANYCRDRKDGRWVLVHQGIAFDTDGLLRDGQHRLRMVVQTGLPTPMFVVWNVPKHSIKQVDGILPRSTRDSLRMADLGDYSCAAIAVANCLRVYPKSPLTRPMTKDQLLSVLTRHAERIAFSEKFQGKAVTRGPRTLLARAFGCEGVDTDRLADFARILITGLPNDAVKDKAALIYRNLLSRHGGHAGPEIEFEKYLKGQSALRYFLASTPIEKLYGTHDDLFPLAPDGAEIAN